MKATFTARAREETTGYDRVGGSWTRGERANREGWGRTVSGRLGHHVGDPLGRAGGFEHDRGRPRDHEEDDTAR